GLSLLRGRQRVLDHDLSLHRDRRRASRALEDRGQEPVLPGARLYDWWQARAPVAAGLRQYLLRLQLRQASRGGVLALAVLDQQGGLGAARGRAQLRL